MKRKKLTKTDMMISKQKILRSRVLYKNISAFKGLNVHAFLLNIIKLRRYMPKADILLCKA